MFPVVEVRPTYPHGTDGEQDLVRFRRRDRNLVNPKVVDRMENCCPVCVVDDMLAEWH